MLWDKAKFINDVGYMELYFLYASSFLSWVIKLAEMCPTALFVYLGTMPTKRKRLFLLFLYLMLEIFLLAVGERNKFVLNVMKEIY
ncbi:O-antigen polysaccharide polymerase Wzy [Bacillus paranthracis]|uniref:O-antigen polysaccharide polymerase Wzy n=1 Tax=Bacillus paranthracis TaxID=2026186 RepID=A0AAX3QDI3_9BACI|nr:O-antigen polysaccharide polymerase Wzy [Bacillus paranthracis]WES06748.1 O-antigen polysaccharide polymerase Wzy [Bacillus paranthracis]